MTNEDLPELSRSLALAWGMAAYPQRGPKRELSIERIVDTAIELADSEGLQAVSMAAVASKLGFTPMSLYRYINAKDDLLLLMQEQVTGQPPESVREQQGWRAQLRALFEAQALMYIRHSWLVSLPITGAPITPNSSAWLDIGLEILQDTPLNHDERLATVLSITGEARWFGIVHTGYAAQARTSGLTTEEVSIQEAKLFDWVITADEFPYLRQAIEAGVFLSDKDPFRFTIERLLDGVESYIEGLKKGKSHETSSRIELDSAEVSGDKRYREAKKAVREAEKALVSARKLERQARREAHERLSQSQKPKSN